MHFRRDMVIRLSFIQVVVYQVRSLYGKKKKKKKKKKKTEVMIRFLKLSVHVYSKIGLGKNWSGRTTFRYQNRGVAPDVTRVLRRCVCCYKYTPRGYEINNNRTGTNSGERRRRHKLTWYIFIAYRIHK